MWTVAFSFPRAKYILSILCKKKLLSCNKGPLGLIYLKYVIYGRKFRSILFDRFSDADRGLILLSTVNKKLASMEVNTSG